MAISAEEVRHVAALAKMAVTDEELATFTAQMDDILGMVEQLQKVDTTGVPMTYNVTDARNVMRPDEAVSGTDRAELMKNVPESEDGYIKVPAIIDESEEG